MTRDEAKKEFQIYIKKISEWYMDIGNHPKKTSTDILDEIFDDFESRICENCKLGVETNLGFIECGLELFNCTDEFFDKDFGCLKFERKDK